MGTLKGTGREIEKEKIMTNETILWAYHQHDIVCNQKLCDITANVLYSVLSGSSMLRKYREEYAVVKSYLYCEEYKEMFENLEGLLGIVR